VGVFYITAGERKRQDVNTVKKWDGTQTVEKGNLARMRTLKEKRGAESINSLKE